MRNALIAGFLLALCMTAPLAKAQDETPKAELYGGYDYVRLNTGGSSFNFNGGGGQFAYNANHWLGLVGDLDGYYTSSAFGAGLFSYMFGPRINVRGHGRVTPFAQVLLGGARSIDTSPLNAFAMTAGGGIDVKISRHFAIRPVQAEYFLTKFTVAATSSIAANNLQNNFRYSAGVIFRFGGK